MLKVKAQGTAVCVRAGKREPIGLEDALRERYQQVQVTPVKLKPLEINGQRLVQLCSKPKLAAGQLANIGPLSACLSVC